MSFRPMGGLCSTVLPPLAHCSVFSLDFWRSLDLTKTSRAFQVMGIGFGCGAGELDVAHRSTKY